MRHLVKEITGMEGAEVNLAGWVAARRDHGKIIFIDLRDRSGIAQIVFTPEIPEAADLRAEYVIQVTGKVKRRPEGMINEKIPTGFYEVEATKLRVISKAEPLPLPIDNDGYEIDENVRLKYRYLDLRRPRLQRNLRLRAQVCDFIREYLKERDFVEIETPILTKSTPEGSRDFLVPSRLQPGKFYALPQSPQQYKQLLMVAGFERYFQIAKALRDEDLRANRAFEHTQLDLEMSFVEQQDVMHLVENLLTELFQKFGKKIYQKPFPVFDYNQVIKKYGDEHIDLREEKDKKDPNILSLAWIINFPVFVKDKKTGKLTYSHNPFTAPHPESIPDLMAGRNLEKIVSLQYDLMCNGQEIAGGGIRIHDPQVLEKVFEILGHTKEEIKSQFGHMLEAFTYGVPPHGGIASGIDRLCMILTGEENLREVVAFPQTSGGQTAVMDAPSEVSKEQLEELGIEIKKRS